MVYLDLQGLKVKVSQSENIHPTIQDHILEDMTSNNTTVRTSDFPNPCSSDPLGRATLIHRTMAEIEIISEMLWFLYERNRTTDKAQNISLKHIMQPSHVFKHN
jgi:hypothetical protein